MAWEARASRWLRDGHGALALGAHAATLAALTCWSWRRWPDPLVDFGRELYVPWRITEGDVLYRDLASLFGPLSPYVNALWFTLFGPSLQTLALCNLGILVVTTWGVHRLLSISTDRVTATTASLVVLVLFGFSQYVSVGNYNFITPYSHEATHGLALSVATLLLLSHAIASSSRMASALAGMCLGLVLLTKPELGLAATLGASTGWIVGYALLESERGALRSCAVLFIATAVVPASCFFAYFTTQMSAAAALEATAGAWVPLIRSDIGSSLFYQRSMGLDAPWTNAGWMLASFAGFATVVLAMVAIALPAGTAPSLRTRLLRSVALVVSTLAATWGDVSRALPIVVLATGAALTWLLVGRRSNAARAARLLPLTMWCVFAFVMLSKLALHARFGHYGFYLALPAATVCIAAVAWLIPLGLEAWRGAEVARSSRRVAVWLTAAAVAPYLILADDWNRTKTLPVGEGADRFYASTLAGQGQGAALQEVKEFVAERAVPGSTLAVLPEGVMLNYLLRARSPLRVINLMPPEMMAFGEDGVLASLGAQAPDFVVLVKRDTSEYGYPPFGATPEYGLRTLRWIEARYSVVHVVRPEPAGDADALMTVLMRKNEEAFRESRPGARVE